MVYIINSSPDSVTMKLFLFYMKYMKELKRLAPNLSVFCFNEYFVEVPDIIYWYCSSFSLIPFDMYTLMTR